MKRIWTDSNRKLLFRKLREKFGPYHTWGNGAKYPKDKRKEYEEYLLELADMFSVIMDKKITVGAVEQQISWAITIQLDIKGTSHTSAYIQNMSAAYNVGFLRNRDFPITLSSERLIQ